MSLLVACRVCRREFLPTARGVVSGYAHIVQEAGQAITATEIWPSKRKFYCSRRCFERRNRQGGRPKDLSKPSRPRHGRPGRPRKGTESRAH